MLLLRMLSSLLYSAWRDHTRSSMSVLTVG
jgi:hypothetical protein